MTLTLNQVQETRFRLARRNGYEPVDVDNFVDEVEATLIELEEEKEALTKQVEALKASSASSDAIFIDAPPASDEANALRAELDSLRTQLGQVESEAAELRHENESLKNENEGLKNELNGLREVLANSEGSESQAAEQIQAVSQQAAEQVAQVQAEADRRVAEISEASEQRIAQAHAEAEAKFNQRLAEVEAAKAGEISDLQQRLAEAENSAAAVPVLNPSEISGPIEVTTTAEASPFVARMIQGAADEAAAITAEANEQARITKEDAGRQAQETIADANTRAERLESEARVNAQQIVSEAQARADALDGQTASRRHELFSTMEQERDILTARVDHLRQWEAKYREAILSHLRGQMKLIDDSSFQGADTPELLADQRDVSASPRLDALLRGEKPAQ